MALGLGVPTLSGCENLTRREAEPLAPISGEAEDSEARGPIGSRSPAQAARRGAWSSEAAEIEKGLTGRQVDPSWPAAWP